jgi:hypothetical protein
MSIYNICVYIFTANIININVSHTYSNYYNITYNTMFDYLQLLVLTMQLLKFSK